MNKLTFRIVSLLLVFSLSVSPAIAAARQDIFETEALVLPPIAATRFAILQIRKSRWIQRWAARYRARSAPFIITPENEGWQWLTKDPRVQEIFEARKDHLHRRLPLRRIQAYLRILRMKG